MHGFPADDQVACCLPHPPCGEVVCASAPTIERCKELARGAARDVVNLASCALHSSSSVSSSRPGKTADHQIEYGLPAWKDVLYPFLLIPLMTLISVSLLWLVLRLVYTQAYRGVSFQRFILNRIGCVDNVYPRNPGFMASMCTLQICASLWTMGIFVFNSYQREVRPMVKWMEIGLGFFLTFHYLIMGMRGEFRLHQLFRLGELVDILTIPNMLLLLVNTEYDEVHWLSLNFLRSIQAMLAYERLDELGFARWSKHELTHEFTLMALRFLAIVVCFASTVLVLEVLGEVPFEKEALINTAMGDISFFTMMYWVIETLSTVGYGDFAPTTFPSRVVTMLCMVSGVTFLTFELDKIFGIIRRQKKGYDIYYSNQSTSRKHVVLVGGGVKRVDETVLIAFLDELFHPSYRNSWPDLVVMTTDGASSEKVREMFDANLDFQARQHVYHLVGSPLTVSDMKRCRCDVAHLIFIMADTTGNPFVEDKENILRALSLKNAFPQIPLRLMLLLPESKEKASSVGIRPQRCFSVNEIKSNLFWQSSRCRGWNTLLCNVMVTSEDEDIERISSLGKGQWLENYLHGLGHEVYGFLPADEFHNESFAHLACEAYKRSGICIFAAQVEGVIVLAPIRERTVQPDQVCFCLAQDSEEITGIATTNRDWKDIFNKNRRAFDAEVDAQRAAGAFAIASSTPELDAVQSDLSAPLMHHEAVATPSSLKDSSEKKGTSSQDSNIARIRFAAQLSSSHDAFVSEQDSYDSDKEEEERIQRKLERIPTLNSDDVIPDTMRESLEQSASAIVKNSSVTPFVLLLDISGSWKQVVPFVEQSRSKYLPFRMPIVVLAPFAPRRIMIEQLKMIDDPSIGWVLGSANWAPDLVKSGVRDATVIVCLGQDLEAVKAGTSMNYSGELTAMIDADVVMLQRMLGRLGVEDKSMIFEFKRIHNMRLLPAVAPVAEEPFKETTDDITAFNGSQIEVDDLILPKKRSSSWCSCFRRKEEISRSTYTPIPLTAEKLVDHAEMATAVSEKGTHCFVCDPRFASGQIFTPQVLGALMARAYHTPGIVEVMQLLVMPASRAGAKSDTVDVNVPWQIRPRSSDVGLTYQQLLTRLVQDQANPAMPLGLFRNFDLDKRKTTGYVWTNPRSSTIILSTDLIYVLGNSGFGKWACDRGLLPMSSKRPRKTGSKERN